MTDYSEDDIDRACEPYEKPQRILTCHVELEDAIWLCGEGGLSMSELIWRVKEAVVADVIEKCRGSKSNAAEVLKISAQTLWNIERGNHK